MIEINVLPEDRRPLPFRRRIGKSIKDGLVGALKWGGIAAISPLWGPFVLYDRFSSSDDEKSVKENIEERAGDVVMTGAAVALSPVWIPILIYDYFTEESEKNLRRKIKKDPANADLHLKLGDMYRRNYETLKNQPQFQNPENLESAIASYERAIFLDKNCAAAYFGLSECHREDPTKRYDYLRKAVKADPNCKPDGGFRTSTVEDKLWDFVCNAVDENTANLVVSETSGRKGYVRWGNLDEILAKFESDVEDFEDRMVEDPNSELLAEYAGYLRENAFDTVTEFVETKLQELIDRDPRNSALHYELGRHLDGRYVEVIRPTSTAVCFSLAYEDPNFNVDDWNFYAATARYFLEHGDTGKAEIALERGIKTLYPDTDIARAVNLLKTNFKEGLELFDKSIGNVSWNAKKDVEFLSQILHAQARVRGIGNTKVDLNEVFTDTLRRIEQLGWSSPTLFSGPLDRTWLGKLSEKEEVTPESVSKFEDIPKENIYALAREFNRLGLYDESSKIFTDLLSNSMSTEEDAEITQLLGDAYEAQWRKTGDKSYLENAWTFYNGSNELIDYKDFGCVEKEICVHKFRGREDKIREVYEKAVAAMKEEDPDTYKRRVMILSRHLGENRHLRKIVAEADTKKDPDVRAGLLSAVVREAPTEFIVKYQVRSKLDEAHKEMNINERYKEAIDSLASEINAAEVITTL
ncbi:hypothetical protein KY343_01405 [Candidatus Woesearchaeota archaeon]|nr:hypothetical protein [Candidatus Woesearchaeota archaeon]